MAWEKAKRELAVHAAAAEDEIAAQQASLEKTRYEIRLAEAAIEALRLEASRDGFFIVGEHPYERHKLQLGDTVWPGVVLAQIPDLSAMRVEAWLSDVDDGTVSEGQPATVVLDSFLPRKASERDMRWGRKSASASRNGSRGNYNVTSAGRELRDAGEDASFADGVEPTGCVEMAGRPVPRESALCQILRRFGRDDILPSSIPRRRDPEPESSLKRHDVSSIWPF